MTRLFSYVVEHDLGFSPNPFGGYCTLAHCKFRRSPRRRNVVELATKGDWVVGTGGASQKSSGHRTLIYAMKVTDKLTLQQYFSDERFRGRADNTRRMLLELIDLPWSQTISSTLASMRFESLHSF
jgi:hypothetical protein